VKLIQGFTSALLTRRHGAFAAQPGYGHAVDEVAVSADCQVQVERMELAEGKAFETVNHERFLTLGRWSVMVEIEQGMTAEPCGLAHDGAVVGLGFAGDLAVSGAGKDAIRHRPKQPGLLEVIGGGESLGAEGGSTVTTAEPGNDLRMGLTGKGPEVDPVPALAA
jgi:hypothetical protein